MYVIAVLKLITLRDVEQLEIICFSALNSPKQAVNSIQCLVNWRAVQRKRLPVTEENEWPDAFLSSPLSALVLTNQISRTG